MLKCLFLKIDYRLQKNRFLFDYRYSSMSSADNGMDCHECVVGEAARNLRPWPDNSLRQCLATHDDLVSRNSLWSRQLPQREKSTLHDWYNEA